MQCTTWSNLIYRGGIGIINEIKLILLHTHTGAHAHTHTQTKFYIND